jgi:hypothetical protein
MRSIGHEERGTFGLALGIVLSIWVAEAALSIVLLLSPFVPSFAVIARALGDLLTADPLAWPIYTT